MSKNNGVGSKSSKGRRTATPGGSQPPRHQGTSSSKETQQRRRFNCSNNDFIFSSASFVHSNFSRREDSEDEADDRRPLPRHEVRRSKRFAEIMLLNVV